MKKNVESILIIGLGMIGASLALASKSKGIKVFGYDSNDLALESANKENYIDDSFKSLEEINNKNLSDKIDLVIVCVPPRQTQEVLNNIHELWNTSMTITDTSSVNIEFVSANPTGPLHLAHGRGAVVGDVLSNICLLYTSPSPRD